MVKRRKTTAKGKRNAAEGKGLTRDAAEQRKRSASPSIRTRHIEQEDSRHQETQEQVYESVEQGFPDSLVYELEPLETLGFEGDSRTGEAGHAEMDQNWSSGYYGYFGNDSATRATDRGGGSSTSPNEDESQQRRPNQYIPPHPHSTSPHAMNLPPFQQTFYPSSYHSPTGPGHPSAGPPVNQTSGGGSLQQQQQQQQQPQHHLSAHPHHGGPGPMGYGNQHMMPPPGANPYPYPVASPAMSAPPLPGSGGPRQPPPHSYNESPRIAGGYSSSPGFHHLSPTSPTNHLIPPGIQASSASTSSSSYQSARAGMNALMRDSGNKRRSGSDDGQSGESWDENDKDGKGLGGEQPWGMPQDEYKALNPRDKKQVRNRIGARRFRAKRKDYVSNLEHTLKQKDDECSTLRTQLESQRSEINDLRHRLGMPLIPAPPPPPVPTSQEGGLGLVVPGGEWGDVKDNRKDL